MNGSPHPHLQGLTDGKGRALAIVVDRVWSMQLIHDLKLVCNAARLHVRLYFSVFVKTIVIQRQPSSFARQKQRVFLDRRFATYRLFQIARNGRTLFRIRQLEFSLVHMLYTEWIRRIRKQIGQDANDRHRHSI